MKRQLCQSSSDRYSQTGWFKPMHRLGWMGFSMPKGPKGQRRPADVIGNAVKVMKIATGEESEDYGADDARTRVRSR